MTGISSESPSLPHRIRWCASKRKNRSDRMRPTWRCLAVMRSSFSTVNASSIVFVASRTCPPILPAAAETRPRELATISSNAEIAGSRGAASVRSLDEAEGADPAGARASSRATAASSLVNSCCSMFLGLDLTPLPPSRLDLLGTKRVKCAASASYTEEMRLMGSPVDSVRCTSLGLCVSCVALQSVPREANRSTRNE